MRRDNGAPTGADGDMSGEAAALVAPPGELRRDKPARAPAPFAVHGLTVAYDGKPVLWDVAWAAPAASLVAIIGPNGAGKSTLLKAALGLVAPSSGSATFFGGKFSAMRERVAYVPQRGSVDWDFPVSAADVVAMGLYGRLGWLARVGRKERERARACLAEVGLSDFADRQISQLSGGQQQRVFIARALAQSADLYLMDEPFAGVDAATERTILEVMRRLREKGATVIVVHHDLATVRSYFDHVLLLNGRVIADGPTADAFTNGNLQKTYGGALGLLDEASEALALARRMAP